MLFYIFTVVSCSLVLAVLPPNGPAAPRLPIEGAWDRDSVEVLFPYTAEVL